ncbi:glycoside hydrolase family 15 protein, partial [Streptomyces sp. NPDC002265]|uniref:glycoside hydrolase family 15 protein n=1 Tax=Streptomyces sp. NPDC002265 TaxID=3154415 RepID=UPI00332BCA14
MSPTRSPPTGTNAATTWANTLRGSRPVRIGNGARQQRQPDVYGELLAAAHRLRGDLAALDTPTNAFLGACADMAATCWDQPDQGIREVRSGPQHFGRSKLMCWIAVDRALALVDAPVRLNCRCVAGPTEPRA